MANPFLFMEEQVSTVNAVTEDFSNPFLVEDDDNEEEAYPSDNPFSSSNPFAFGDAEETETVGDIFSSETGAETGASLFLVEDDHEDDLEVDATMSFFGTTINEHDGLQYHKPTDLNVEIIENEDEPRVQKPPRPNPPPSQVTQQLITNLTDHLDQTSNNLLGKIPVTRSPSPVSMRDLHTPSPTHEVSDLLDVSEAFKQDSIIAPAEVKPSRPPPPRPIPPRPTPPKISPVTNESPFQAVTATQAQSQQEDDLFNFFGTGQQKKPPPKPPAPKTKEDILSLFNPASNQPAQQATKPDLLSEDIDFSMQQQQSQNQTQAPVAIVQPYDPQPEVVMEVPTAIPQAVVEPMINHDVAKSPSITETLTDVNSYQPEYEVAASIVEETVLQKSADHSPESGITSGVISASRSGSIFNEAVQEVETIESVPEPMIAEPMIEITASVDPPKVADLTPPEELQKLQFLDQKTTEYQYQRPTTPDPIVAQPELAPIFGSPLVPVAATPFITQPETAPIFGNPVPPVLAKPSPPPPPTRGGSMLTSVQQPVVPEIFRSDEFDDFSAKFESKSQPKSTGNAFLDSLEEDKPKTVVAADAWGDSSDAFGTTAAAENCFANDEDGFDSWDPPVVPESTPYMTRRMSTGSDDGVAKDFSVVIKPKTDTEYATAGPILGPPVPQKSPYSGSAYSEGERKVTRTWRESYC